MNESDESAVRRGWTFSLTNVWLVALVSAAVVVPCFWHAHIEAGDLGSHVYNAWLAQLIGKGQAPGLYLVSQWHNVLFDFLLLHVANVAGFGVAEKFGVVLAVLIFFWGAFALIAVLAGRAPWFVAPLLAMLAYGYCFHMGFFNYYISIGLACWSLAIFLASIKPGGEVGADGHDRKGNWGSGDLKVVLAILPVIYLAHPIGFLFAVGGMVYFALRKFLPGYWKLALPVAVVVAVFALRWFLLQHDQFELDWTKPGPFYTLNGSDQIVVYGDQYGQLARVAVLFAVICVLVDAVLRRHGGWAAFKPFVLPLELWALTFVVPIFLPENLRTAPDQAWMGLLVSRLTILTAIFGLSVLACLKPRKWHLAGFALLATAYFVFLYNDTAYLNQLERNAEAVVWPLPYGTRVIAKLDALPDSRIEFVGHLLDRVCIGHCFTYMNYEAPTRQFRVRAREGSPIAHSTIAEYEEMGDDAYVYRTQDLPLIQVFQCDTDDPTRVCVHQLAAGDKVATADAGNP
jgi:hypothetical protein